MILVPHLFFSKGQNEDNGLNAFDTTFPAFSPQQEVEESHDNENPPVNES